MTEREALIRAVCCDPDDDTVRLVFADWLDENGEPERAEFVRVQCEYDRLPEWGQQKSDWRDRSEQLGMRMRTTLPDVIRIRDLLKSSVSVNRVRLWSGFGTTEVFVSRGFISSITCTQADFLAHAGAIFAQHPVTKVRLSDCDPSYCVDRDGSRKVRWGIVDDDEVNRIEVFDRCHIMPPIGKLIPKSPGWTYSRVFPTSDLAHAALSDACVLHGRTLAGLPPLNRAISCRG